MSPLDRDIVGLMFFIIAGSDTNNILSRLSDPQRRAKETATPGR
ncbi:MAG: hypothetical protein A4E57_01823 [Syntrophorhabdaceae bacterium PtaU1.Bin034]|nr:MAG: hypothetical protein A4E57_01823 [Syntrophorhabdaceae bacterium PtaU1.Bin034]